MIWWQQLNDLRYSVDDDPFEVTPKVVENITKSSQKLSDKRGVTPDPVSSYMDQEESVGTGTGPSDETVIGAAKRVQTVSEQVDDMIDQSIEIESNKKMFKENVRWFPLTFTSKEMELKVCYVFKS